MGSGALGIRTVSVLDVQLSPQVDEEDEGRECLLPPEGSIVKSCPAIPV